MLSCVSEDNQWSLCGRGTREETRQEAEDQARTHLSDEISHGPELKSQSAVRARGTWEQLRR